MAVQLIDLPHQLLELLKFVTGDRVLGAPEDGVTMVERDKEPLTQDMHLFRAYDE